MLHFSDFCDMATVAITLVEVSPHCEHQQTMSRRAEGVKMFANDEIDDLSAS